MTDPATAAGWIAWLVFALALALTIAAVVLSCSVSSDDLADAQHELALDDLWGPDEEWIEAT